MSKKSDAIRAELDRIAKKSGGVLWPEKVVDAARDESSPLHSRFEWDDSEAAERYRVWQARQLIAITVNVIEGSADDEQLWVSLKPDRAESGGYRSMVNVLSDKNLRDQLLSDALEDMRIFERKYRHLKELANVFSAMERTRRKRAA